MALKSTTDYASTQSDQDIIWVDWEKVSEVEGILHRVLQGKGQHKTDIYILRDKNGNDFGIWSSRLIKDRLISGKVIDDKTGTIKKGAYIMIKYIGIRQGKSRSYKNFDVLVDVNENNEVIIHPIPHSIEEPENTNEKQINPNYENDEEPPF